MGHSASSEARAWLSEGMKRCLSRAAVTILEPQNIFLDECSIGADPVARPEIWKMVLAAVLKASLAFALSHPCLAQGALGLGAAWPCLEPQSAAGWAQLLLVAVLLQ